MLGSKYMQGCIFAFLILTLLSLILEGAFFGEAEDNLLNDITSWTIGMSSWWSMPIVFVSVLESLPKLLSWNYSFFTAMGTGGAIIRLILGVTISFGIIWGFLALLLPVVLNAMINVGRGIIGLLR